MNLMMRHESQMAAPETPKSKSEIKAEAKATREWQREADDKLRKEVAKFLSAGQEYTAPDYIDRVRAAEFQGDVSVVPQADKRLKVGFEMKSRS